MEYGIISDWNKKLDLSHIGDLYDTDYEGWDKINGKLIEVRINYYYKQGEDLQQDMNVWVDDNNNGYFYSSICYTEGGTAIVRTGEKIGISFTFQKKEDAVAFKLRWC